MHNPDFITSVDQCFGGLQSSDIQAISANCHKSYTNIVTGRCVVSDNFIYNNRYHFSEYKLALPKRVPFNQLSSAELTELFKWAHKCVACGEKLRINIKKRPNNHSCFDYAYDSDHDDDIDDDSDIDDFIVDDDVVEYESDPEQQDDSCGEPCKKRRKILYDDDEDDEND